MVLHERIYSSENMCGILIYTGAACHSCTMISETACENGNRLLDRALVVPVPEHEEMGYVTAMDVMFPREEIKPEYITNLLLKDYSLLVLIEGGLI